MLCYVFVVCFVVVCGVRVLMCLVWCVVVCFALFGVRVPCLCLLCLGWVGVAVGLCWCVCCCCVCCVDVVVVVCGVMCCVVVCCCFGCELFVVCGVVCVVMFALCL